MTSDHLQKVFSITIQHEYFTSGIFDLIQLTADEKTHSVLSQSGFYIAEHEGGLGLYSATDKSLNDQLSEFISSNAASYFVFNINALSPEAISITKDFPLYELVQMHHSNTISFTEGSEIILANTSSLADASQLFGQVYISLEQLLADLSTTNDINYIVKYKARKTYWKYYIINKSNQRFENLTITSTEGVEFADPVEVQLQNGETAMEFLSNKPLAYSEKPRITFQLTSDKQNGQGKQLVFDSLPYPHPLQYKLEEREGEKVVVSQMYVYI